MTQPDEPMSDPLLDPAIRDLYLNPTIWSNSPEKAAVIEKVNAYFASRYDTTHDLPKEKADAALRQSIERHMDQDALANPTEFQERHGYLRQTFDQFISEPQAPQLQGLQALALELDEVLKNPAYMDASHHAHTWYVEKASQLYRAIYDSGPDGGRRG